MLLRFFRIRTFKHMFETNRSKSKNKFVRFSDQKTKNSGRLKTGHSFWILDRFFCIKNILPASTCGCCCCCCCCCCCPWLLQCAVPPRRPPATLGGRRRHRLHSSTDVRSEQKSPGRRRRFLTAVKINFKFFLWLCIRFLNIHLTVDFVRLRSRSFLTTGLVIQIALSFYLPSVRFSFFKNQYIT